MNKQVITVRLPAELAERLNHLSEKTKLPKSFYIKELLEEHLPDLEDAYLALDRLTDRNSRHYSTQEVEKILEP